MLHSTDRRRGFIRWISAIAKMLVCLWLALAVVPSWAQRPPTNDVSDRMGNTGGGTGALTSITTGGANTAYGNAALRTNTTGGNNTAVGTLALSFSNTGNNNTGVGSSTLEINGAGDNNTAVGSQLGARIERVVYHDEDNRNAGRFLPRRSRPSSWWRYEAEAEAPWMRRAWVDSGVRSDALQGSAIDGMADCASAGALLSSPAPSAHRCAAAGLDSSTAAERWDPCRSTAQWIV
jgi:hypothetical protein